ncbi:MAG: sigma-70 family RNA polymerase sigma factor, partial [Myxococcota bacterium]
ALDVVQEAFIKVYRHIDNFQGNSSFYTWLYRIVTNLAIDHVRKRRRGSEQECEETRLSPDGELQLPQFLNSNPVRTVLRKELLEAIHSALSELPEYHRAVILLREVEGLSYDEIATILEVPKGTIMSRLFHARRRMQQVLAEYLQGDLSIEEAP